MIEEKLDIRGQGYDEILRFAQNDKQANSPNGSGGVIKNVAINIFSIYQ